MKCILNKNVFVVHCQSISILCPTVQIVSSYCRVVFAFYLKAGSG